LNKNKRTFSKFKELFAVIYFCSLAILGFNAFFNVLHVSADHLNVLNKNGLRKPYASNFISSKIYSNEESKDDNGVFTGQDGDELTWKYYSKDSNDYKADTLVIDGGYMQTPVNEWNLPRDSNGNLEVKHIDFEGEVILPVDCSSFFANLTNLVDIKNGQNVYTDEVVTMKEMFKNDTRLFNLDYLKHWDTSQVQDMS
jgi:surface protein